MKYSLLIADDEQHVCLELQYMLAKFPDIEVVKSCSDGDAALEAIIELQPDIVFLDIAMPGLNGIQLGRVLRTTGHVPYITYVTAYETHAIDAFKVGAKGYVLKPFSQGDIEEQVERARNYFQTLKRSSPEPLPDKFQANQQGAKAELPYVAVEENGRFILVAQSDIVMAYANDREVFLRAGAKDYPCSHSLSELEQSLQSQSFFRCHRNYIVNIHHIKEIQPWFHGTYQLILADNLAAIPVSRSKVKEFRGKFRI
jgi:DNA-binding LytR/AlgR family response regulator